MQLLALRVQKIIFQKQYILLQKRIAGDAQEAHLPGQEQTGREIVLAFQEIT